MYQCFLSPLLCTFQIHCDGSEEKQFILAFDDDGNDDDDDYDDDDVELNVLFLNFVLKGERTEQFLRSRRRSEFRR